MRWGEVKWGGSFEGQVWRQIHPRGRIEFDREIKKLTNWSC